MATVLRTLPNLGKFRRIAWCMAGDLTLTPEASRELDLVKRGVDLMLGGIPATSIVFLPFGGIVETDVQGALEGLETRKATTTALAAGLAGKQPLDATLTAVAGAATGADKLIYWTGVDVAAVTTFSPFARTLLDDADAATMRATIGAGTGSGDVAGPAAATANALALFNGATGKVIKDSVTTLDTDGTLAGNSDTRVATQKAVKTYVDRPRYSRMFLLMGG